MQLFALVAVPTILIPVIAHFLIKRSSARAKAELIRRSIRSTLNLVDRRLGWHTGVEGSKSAAGSATFKTRRQSLLAGRSAMREMLATVHSEKAMELVTGLMLKMRYRGC